MRLVDRRPVFCDVSAHAAENSSRSNSQIDINSSKSSVSLRHSRIEYPISKEPIKNPSTSIQNLDHVQTLVEIITDTKHLELPMKSTSFQENLHILFHFFPTILV